MSETDPFRKFNIWFEAAVATEPKLPQAMTLATVSADGRPSTRMVLLKDHGPQGFVFYTNLKSSKGRDLRTNSNASLCFHWKSLGRQVRIDGSAILVSDEEADAYFASRPRGSQIGAWASEQSAPVNTRDMLEARVRDIMAAYEGCDVPRPPHWSGFRVTPARIEFWQDRPDRLHDRELFECDGGNWHAIRLQP
ncbi:MAG: pyridoxamine 5'-phosphate oxidase [Alphaproteobacteria bacterium]|nr:pyridoxamine 5'-phosphate oxidase [Alphaproteobacteria bacterium]HCP01492.1 pyridoxamine 5'-phosphate oxidase [Rhodospirillaceae bacterium]